METNRRIGAAQSSQGECEASVRTQRPQRTERAAQRLDGDDPMWPPAIETCVGALARARRVGTWVVASESPGNRITLLAVSQLWGPLQYHVPVIQACYVSRVVLTYLSPTQQRFMWGPVFPGLTRKPLLQLGGGA